jgi:hypothetical protein
LTVFNGTGPLAETSLLLLLNGSPLVKTETVWIAHLRVYLAIFELLLALVVETLGSAGFWDHDALGSLLLDGFKKRIVDFLTFLSVLVVSGALRRGSGGKCWRRHLRLLSFELVQEGLLGTVWPLLADSGWDIAGVTSDWPLLLSRGLIHRLIFTLVILSGIGSKFLIFCKCLKRHIFLLII